MTTHEDLIVARALIADERNFGRGMLIDDDMRLCAIGAIAVAACLEPFDIGRIDASAAFRALHAATIIDPSLFNDTQPHSAVLRAFDIAISATTP